MRIHFRTDSNKQSWPKSWKALFFLTEWKLQFWSADNLFQVYPCTDSAYAIFGHSDPIWIRDLQRTNRGYLQARWPSTFKLDLNVWQRVSTLTFARSQRVRRLHSFLFDLRYSSVFNSFDLQSHENIRRSAQNSFEWYFLGNELYYDSCPISSVPYQDIDVNLVLSSIREHLQHASSTWTLLWNASSIHLHHIGTNYRC